MSKYDNLKKSGESNGICDFCGTYDKVVDLPGDRVMAGFCICRNCADPKTSNKKDKQLKKDSHNIIKGKMMFFRRLKSK